MEEYTPEPSTRARRRRARSSSRRGSRRGRQRARQAARAAPRRGRPRQGRSRGYRWRVGIVGLLIVAAGRRAAVGRRLARATPSEHRRRAATRAPRHAGHAAQPPGTATQAVARRRRAGVAEAANRRRSVRVPDRRARTQADPRPDPQAGPEHAEYHARRFLITLGNSAMTLIVNGTPRTVPPSSDAIGYAITRTGSAHWLPPNSRSAGTCKPTLQRERARGNRGSRAPRC